MNYLRESTSELTVPHRRYRNGDIQAKGKLLGYGNLYHCLLVRVVTALQWTRDDVLANGGTFIGDNSVEEPLEIRN